MTSAERRARNQKIIDAYISWEPMASILEEFSPVRGGKPMTRANLYALLSRNKVSPRGKSQLSNPEKVKIAVEMFKDGKSISSICKTLHATATTVSAVLKEAGYEVKIGARSKYDQATIDAVVQMYKTEWPTETSRSMGIPYQTVSRLALKAGAKYRQSKHANVA